MCVSVARSVVEVMGVQRGPETMLVGVQGAFFVFGFGEMQMFLSLVLLL